MLEKSFGQIEEITEEPGTSADYAERASAKKARMASTDFGSLHWVPVTSNVAERFFSKAKQVFNPSRKGLLPRRLEMQLFLLVNEKYWSANTVSKLMSDN